MFVPSDGPDAQREPEPVAVSTVSSVAARALASRLGLRAAGEIERSRWRSALLRRIRTRTRYDDVLSLPRWEVAPPRSGVGADPARTLEALRILRLRATLALSWGSVHRNARMGVLDAHSSTCPSPGRA